MALGSPDSTNGYSAECVPTEIQDAAASLRMVGPRDLQPNELDHEISFVCSIASVLYSASLRMKRKGKLRKGSFFTLSGCGKIDKKGDPSGSPGGRCGPASLREQGSLRAPTVRWMSYTSHGQHSHLLIARLSVHNS